jgi:AcrR family transcriptional regulator
MDRSDGMKATAPKQPSRDKILDVAENLFARRGFAGVGLSEVAEGTGLGKSSLFHHFRSKAELYAAVIGRILARIEATLLRALAQGGDPVTRLDRLMDALIDELAAHQTYARLLLRSLFEDDELAGDLPEEQVANDTLRRITGGMAQLLREGMSAGVFRLASVTHTLQSLIGITIYHFASGEFGDELVGRSVFSAAEVKRRKLEVRALLHGGLLRRSMA